MIQTCWLFPVAVFLEHTLQWWWTHTGCFMRVQCRPMLMVNMKGNPFIHIHFVLSLEYMGVLQRGHSTYHLLQLQQTAGGRPPVENRQDLTVFWTVSWPLKREQDQWTQVEHTDTLWLGLSEAVTEEHFPSPSVQPSSSERGRGSIFTHSEVVHCHLILLPYTETLYNIVH